MVNCLYPFPLGIIVRWSEIIIIYLFTGCDLLVLMIQRPLWSPILFKWADSRSSAPVEQSRRTAPQKCRYQTSSQLHTLTPLIMLCNFSTNIWRVSPQPIRKNKVQYFTRKLTRERWSDDLSFQFNNNALHVLAVRLLNHTRQTDDCSSITIHFDRKWILLYWYK